MIAGTVDLDLRFPGRWCQREGGPMRIDVLSSLHSGELTEEHAQAIVGEVIASQLAGEVLSVLGFSRAEWTAYGQGASLSEISHWRCHGWPGYCCRCGRTLDFVEFGWRVVDCEGKCALQHIICPS